MKQHSVKQGFLITYSHEFRQTIFLIQTNTSNKHISIERNQFTAIKLYYVNRNAKYALFTFLKSNAFGANGIVKLSRPNFLL